MNTHTPSADGALTLVEADGQLYADSRNVAAGLDVEHTTLVATIDKHKQLIESEFGRVLFQRGPFQTPGGVQQIRYALLTEDQANYVGTLSRNTPTVMRFKAALIKAFRDARRALEAQQQQPAPTPQYEIPATFSEALLLAGRLQAENERLDAKLRNRTDLLVEALPVVDAYEEFLSHDETEHSWKVVADLLRDHGVGRNRLLRILRAEGVLIDGGVNHNTPYRKYVEAGYFRVKFHPDFPETPVTRTTTKGIAFLSRKLAQLRGRAKRAPLQQQA